jgi:MHS family alpha-ketoglutarate permease-like MFS transporter
MNVARAEADAEAAGTVGGRLASIFAGSVGNLIEWYDFYVYAFFSLYFAKAFFPGSSQTGQFLNTAGIFALGFIMRPIGGYVMGVYADRHGRRSALMVSVVLMCLGSLIVGLCPVYADVGVLAPLILVAARMLQGLSLGGEYGASATYLSEIATSRHRGFYSSFQYVTLIGGQLLASVTLLILQRLLLNGPQLEAWGWRIPFLIGAALALLGFWLRRNMAETAAFLSEQGQHGARHPLRDLAQHKREVAIVVGLTAGGTLAFYTYTVYMPKFLVNSVGLTRDTATLISTISLFIYMCLQPAVGALSDIVGRRPVLIGFGVLGTLFTVPILTALTHTKDAVTAFLLVLAALVIVSFYTSINAVVKAELFPASIRALGVALPYAVTVSVFGGTAEYVGLWFRSVGHEPWFYWYVTACVFASLLVYVSMRDTRRTSHIDRD